MTIAPMIDMPAVIASMVILFLSDKVLRGVVFVPDLLHEWTISLGIAINLPNLPIRQR